MSARRLRTDIRRLFKFSRRKCAPAHQLKQHCCPGWLAQQIRRNRNCVVHGLSISLLFLKHFGPRRNIFQPLRRLIAPGRTLCIPCSCVTPSIPTNSPTGEPMPKLSSLPLPNLVGRLSAITRPPNSPEILPKPSPPSTLAPWPSTRSTAPGSQPIQSIKNTLQSSRLPAPSAPSTAPSSSASNPQRQGDEHIPANPRL